MKIMKTRKEKTEIPENIPIITQEMMEKTAIEIAKKHNDRKQSPVKGVKDISCPSCGNSTISYADDLTFDVTLTGERIVIPNLTGLKCSKCDVVAFDARSTKIIENYTADKPAGGYELNVSTVGGGKLGMYFPRDVLRVMKISKNDKAILTPLSKRKMVIELLNSTA
ncbi:MAG: YgiT-type zinc finger protein [Methanosarcinales archaeon]|nr:MAG: YgiT-type zinc finger protein [Methanosarcinales archaeon]